MANFLSFLRALPALISLARELWKALKELHEAHQRKVRIEKLKEAILDARIKKDTAKLEKLFNDNADISSDIHSMQDRTP